MKNTAAVKEETTEVGDKPSVPDYTTVAALKRSKLAAIVERHAEIDRQIKELEAERKELKAAGIDLFVRNEIKSVLVNGRIVTRVDGMSVTLSKAKLVELGVSDKVLEKATSRKPWTSLKVGKLPGEGEEEK